MAIKPPISTISFYDEYTREQFVDEVVNNGGSLVIPGPVYVVHNIYDQSTGTGIFTSEQQAFLYVMSIVLEGSSFDNLNNRTVYKVANGVKITRIPSRKTILSIEVNVFGHEIIPITKYKEHFREIFDCWEEVHNNFVAAKHIDRAYCVFFKHPASNGKYEGCGASLMDIAKQPDKVNAAWLHWCVYESILPQALQDTVLDSQGVNVFKKVIMPKTYSIALAINQNSYDTYAGLNDVTVTLM